MIYTDGQRAWHACMEEPPYERNPAFAPANSCFERTGLREVRPHCHRRSSLLAPRFPLKGATKIGGDAEAAHSQEPLESPSPSYTLVSIPALQARRLLVIMAFTRPITAYVKSSG